MNNLNQLDQAVKKILTEESETDPWTELCVAAIKLGAAMARFDCAMAKYKRSGVQEVHH